MNYWERGRPVRTERSEEDCGYAVGDETAALPVTRRLALPTSLKGVV